MPKSKKKKQDFQKVKLKVGKRLPKGDNVTNLSFKTRQIQLTQRIKDDCGQGLITKKKQNVQELLRQCDHHSSSSRLNAVMGLRELWINSYEEMMVPTNVFGYSSVLKKLSSLLVDNEATVRHAVVNLFKIILHKITKDASISDRLLGGTLFAHLHAFLCCAMNHIHEDIRLDALLLYDALLETCPLLVVQQTGGLLRNLVGLLATPNHVGSHGDFTTQKLSLNPESKLPVMVFRIRVLSRIKQTLKAAVDNFLAPTSCSSHPPVSCPIWSVYNDHHESRLKQSTLIAPRHVVGRFSLIASGSSHELDDYITNSSSLESFMHQCIPVLNQCWKEAIADNDAQNETVSLLSSNALEVIHLIVSIIQSLFVLAVFKKDHSKYRGVPQTSLIPPEVITKNFLPSIESLVMAGFPYSAQLAPSAGKKKGKQKKMKDFNIQTDAAMQVSLAALNLGICEIMSIFCSDLNVKFNKKRLKKISQHVIMAIKGSPNMDQSRAIVRTIKNVFMNPNTADCFAKVYKMAFKWYMKSKPKSGQKKMLFDLFASIGCAWDGWSSNDSQSFLVHRYQKNEMMECTFGAFFKSLPQLLLTVKPLGDEAWTLDVLKLMGHGHVRQHGVTLEQELSQILDPDNGLFTCSNEQMQQRLFAILSCGTRFTKENLRQLLNLLRCPPDKPVICNRKSWSCVKHSLFAIFANIRANVPMRNQAEFNQMSQEHHQQLSDYLRFLFSLLIGFTGEDLDSICPKQADSEERPSWFSIDFTMSEAQFDRHLEIATVVSGEIAGFSLQVQPDLGHKHVFTFISNFEHFWTQTFAKRSKMHILSAIGLNSLLIQMSQHHRVEKPGQELISLASLSLASVLWQLFHTSTTPSAWVAKKVKVEVVALLTALSTTSSSVLRQMIQHLDDRATGSFSGSDADIQAAKSAKDFIFTCDTLRHKLEEPV